MFRDLHISDERNLPPRAAVFLGGYGRFAAVTAEAFAASRRSWRRSLPLCGGHGHGGGLFYTDTKTTQENASHATSAFLSQELAWGLRLFAALAPPGEIFGEIVENKRKTSRKKPPPLAVGGGHVAVFGRAALEVTAVFCGHGRWFILEVFLGFSIWRLKRHNP